MVPSAQTVCICSVTSELNEGVGDYVFLWNMIV